MTATRHQRRTLTGIVKSTKCAKTITVEVSRTTKHAKYGKFVRSHKRYHAHDETQQAEPGDTVEIVATRPLSKTKRWRLVRVLERNRLIELSSAEGEAVKRATEEASGLESSPDDYTGDAR